MNKQHRVVPNHGAFPLKEFDIISYTSMIQHQTPEAGSAPEFARTSMVF